MTSYAPRAPPKGSTPGNMRRLEVLMQSLMRAVRTPSSRVATAVLVLAGALASVMSEAWHVSFSGLDLGMFGFGLSLPLWMLWLTEPEGLPLEHRQRLPESRVRRLALAPFLPGGGRAALLFTLELLALTLASLAGNRFAASSGWEGWVKSSMVACYLATWMLVPTALLSRWFRRKEVRFLAPVATMFWILNVAPLLAWLVPALPDYTGKIFEHYGHVRPDGFIPEKYRPAYAAMWVMMLLSITVSAPRIVRGVREVLGPRPASRPAKPPLGVHRTGRLHRQS
jgi:hypothetical protein